MIIFLDLDGVIINWVKGVFDWYNIHYEPSRVTHYSAMYDIVDRKPKQFWNDLKNAEFWENLEFYPGAENLIERLQQYGEVILLTSPAIGCAGYRQNWIQANLPNFFTRGHYLIGPAKYVCAGFYKILIDDSDDNCNKFLSNGGQTITYPQLWNELGQQFEEITIENKNNYVIKRLLSFIM